MTDLIDPINKASPSHEAFLAFNSALMTEGDLADYLQLSKQTLRNWRVQGKGPKFVKISGRAVRYRMPDIRAWSEDLIVSSTSGA